MPPLLCYFYYPIAAYAVGGFEVHLAATQKAVEATSSMLECVDAGTSLDKKDTWLLSDDQRWNRIPWNRIVSVRVE